MEFRPSELHEVVGMMFVNVSLASQVSTGFALKASGLPDCMLPGNDEEWA